MKSKNPPTSMTYNRAIDILSTCALSSTIKREGYDTLHIEVARDAIVTLLSQYQRAVTLLEALDENASTLGKTLKRLNKQIREITE